jgi:ring-1,2-phenylacetyl-CoA epoxidase subunit PaaE
MLNSWVYVIIFLMPISAMAIGTVHILGLLNNIKSHLGYEFYPRWFENTPLKYLANSTHHNLHHTRYNGNYGLFFTFWDRWLGTEFDHFESYVSQVKNRAPVSEIVDNTTYKPLSIHEIKRETDDTVSIVFKPGDKNFYNYLPGSYINLRFTINNKLYDRVFSLSSCPYTDDFLRVTVKKHGIVTSHLYDSAKTGDDFKALYPSGEFTIQESELVQTNRYLMIAGGSGITPLFSMIRSLMVKNPLNNVTLLYASRSKNDTVFYGQLIELQNQYANLRVRFFHSNENRLNEESIASAVQDAESDKSNLKIYICGPESLKNDLKKHLKVAGISKRQIQEEEFADGYVSLFSAVKDKLFKKA